MHTQGEEPSTHKRRHIYIHTDSFTFNTYTTLMGSYGVPVLGPSPRDLPWPSVGGTTSVLWTVTVLAGVPVSVTCVEPSF